jgi:hypothetical protein
MKRSILAGLILMAAINGCGRDADRPDQGPVDAPLTVAPLGGGDGCNDLPVGDEFERVDRYEPEFTNPTRITNPLFPALDRVVSVGEEDGEIVRIESTRLKNTRTITLENGDRVAAVQVRTIEWRDGELAEITTDFYAQDDVGAVWYLGEDVARYEDGRVVDNEGTWLAGRDAPPGMIMPAFPAPGDVWRPENNCGVIFEEVTLLEENVTIEGPGGTITNAIRVRELHMDGATEEKIYAPGYGAIAEGSEPDVVSIGVATPTDDRPGATPAAICSMWQDAEFVANFAAFRRWPGLAEVAGKLRTRFETYQASGVPPLLESAMFDALDELDAAIAGQDPTAALRAAIDIEMALLDLRLPFENAWVVDAVRLKVWERQLALDRRLGDDDAVRSDLASIEALKKLLAQ